MFRTRCRSARSSYPKEPKSPENLSLKRECLSRNLIRSVQPIHSSGLSTIEQIVTPFLSSVKRVSLEQQKSRTLSDPAPALRKHISNTAENEKADLTSAFGVCPLFGATTLFTSSEVRFSHRAYALKGFPFLCFVLSGLNPFQDSCGFPNPIRLIS